MWTSKKEACQFRRGNFVSIINKQKIVEIEIKGQIKFTIECGSTGYGGVAYDSGQSSIRCQNS